MKRAGGHDGAPNAKRSRSRSTSPLRYDPAMPLRERLEQFCTPRKRNTDRAKSRSASELDPKVAALAARLPITWLRCGEPPKLARLLGAHDANAQNITVGCHCDICQEWNREEEQADSEADTDEEQQQRGVARSSAESSGDSTGTGNSAAAGGSGGTAPAASPLCGRVYNLPQWLEHCTGLRISGLDPNRQAADYRDLVLSAVEVAADTDVPQAQDQHEPEARQDSRSAGSRLLQRGPHLQMVTRAAAGVDVPGSMGAAAAATARPMSLRDYLRYLTTTELAAAAQLLQERQPGAGGSDAAAGGSSSLTGRRLHVFYAEELPRPRWFSGAVLQPAADLVRLQVQWDAWTDYQGVTNPATKDEVLMGVTLLHWGNSAPQQLPDCPGGADICVLPSLEQQQQLSAQREGPAAAPGSTAEAAGGSVGEQAEPGTREVAGAQQGQFERPARRPADQLVGASRPALNPDQGPDTGMGEDQGVDLQGNTAVAAMAAVAAVCRSWAFEQQLPLAVQAVQQPAVQAQQEQALMPAGRGPAVAAVPNDAGYCSSAPTRSTSPCRAGANTPAPVPLAAACGESRTAAAAGVERLLAVITTHSTSSTSTSTSTASQHGAGPTVASACDVKGPSYQQIGGRSAPAAILLSAGRSPMPSEPPTDTDVRDGLHQAASGTPVADGRSSSHQAQATLGPAHAQPARGLKSLRRMPLAQQPSTSQSQPAPLAPPPTTLLASKVARSQDYELRSSSDGERDDYAATPEPGSPGHGSSRRVEAHQHSGAAGQLADAPPALAPTAMPQSRRASPSVLHPSWFEPAAADSTEAVAPQEALLPEAAAASQAAAPPQAGQAAAPVDVAVAVMQSARASEAAGPVESLQRDAAVILAVAAHPAHGVAEPAAGRLGADEPATAAAKAGVPLAAAAVDPLLPPKSSEAAVPGTAAAESQEVAAAPHMRTGQDSVQTALAIRKVAPPEGPPDALATMAAEAVPGAGRIGTGEGIQGSGDDATYGNRVEQGRTESTPSAGAPAAASTYAGDGGCLRGSFPPPSPSGALPLLVPSPSCGADLEAAAAQQPHTQPVQTYDQLHANADAHERPLETCGGSHKANEHQPEAGATDADTARPPLLQPVAQPEAVGLGPRLVLSSPRCLASAQTGHLALAGRCRELGDRFAQQLQHCQRPAHRRPSPGRQLLEGDAAPSRTSAGPVTDAGASGAAVGARAAEARLTVLLANATNPANTRVSPQQHGALEAALLRYMQLQAGSDGEGNAGSAPDALQLAAQGPEPCSRVSLEHPELVALPLDLQHGHTLQLVAEHLHHQQQHQQHDQQQECLGQGRQTAAGRGAADVLHSVASAPLASAARAGAMPGHGSVPAAGMATSFVTTCTSRDWANAGADVSVELLIKLITCAIPGAVGLHQVVISLSVRMPSALHRSLSEPARILDWHAFTRLAVWLGVGLNQVASTSSKAGASACAQQQVDEGARLLQQLLNPHELLAPLPQPQPGVCYQPQVQSTAEQEPKQPCHAPHIQPPHEQTLPGSAPGGRYAAVPAAADRASHVQRLVLALDPVLLRALEEFELRRAAMPLLEELSAETAAQGWAAALSQLSRLAKAKEQQVLQQPEQQPGLRPLDAGKQEGQAACTAVLRLHGLLGVAAALAVEAAEMNGLTGSSESEANRRSRSSDIGPPLAQLLELYWAAKRCFRTEEWWDGVVRLQALMAAVQRQAAAASRQHRHSVLEVCSRLLFSPNWPVSLQLPGMGPHDPVRLAAAWDEVLEEARCRRRQQQQEAQEEADVGTMGQQAPQAQTRGNPLQQRQVHSQAAVGVAAAASGSQPLTAGPGPGPRATATRRVEPLLGHLSGHQAAHQGPRAAAQADMRAAPARTHKTTSPQLQQQQFQYQQQQQQHLHQHHHQPVQPPPPLQSLPKGQQQVQAPQLPQQTGPLGLQLLQQAQFIQQQQVLNHQRQMLGQQMLLQLLQQQQQHMAHPQSVAPALVAAPAQAPQPQQQQQHAVYAGVGAVPQAAVTAQPPPQQQAAAVPAEVLGAADDAAAAGQVQVGILVRGWREVGPEGSGQHRLYTMLYEYEGLGGLETTYSVDSDQVPLLELPVGEMRELALHTVACSVASQLRAVGIPPPPHVERALLDPAATTPEHLAWLVANLRAYTSRAGQTGQAGTAARPPPPPAPPPPPPPPAGRPAAAASAYTAAPRQQAQASREHQHQQHQPHHYRQQQAYVHAPASVSVPGRVNGTWPVQVTAATPSGTQWVAPVPGQNTHAGADAAAAGAAVAAAAMGQQYYAPAALAQHVSVAAQAATAANRLPPPPAAGARVNTLGDFWDELG